MINRKIRNKKKTENFIKQYPIIFLIQHHNFSVIDWFNFKQNLQEILSNSSNNLSTSQIEILNRKNSLLKKVLNQSFKGKNLKSLDSLFQGPNFLLGCENDDHLKIIWNSINSNSKLLFISCFYRNTLLNHLDLSILLETNSSIYSNLLYNLNKTNEFFDTLQNVKEISPLYFIQSNLINVLSSIRKN